MYRAKAAKALSLLQEKRKKPSTVNDNKKSGKNINHLKKKKKGTMKRKP